MPMTFASRTSSDRFQWCTTFAAVISLLILIACRHTSTSEATASHQYVGCYKDNGQQRAMEFHHSNNHVNNTPQSCSELCTERNYSYAGLQYSYNCYCGDSYDKYGVSTACNMPCTGDKKTICGGVYANSVYSVCPVGNYGQLCTGRCHCLNNERCIYRNGTCPSSQCEKGWTGISCNIRGNCSLKVCDSESMICTNTVRGYNCSCKRGFLVHNATACIDIDECEENTCDNSTTECHNTPGSYKCICKQGFCNGYSCTGERTIVTGVIGLLIGVALTLAVGFAFHHIICREKYRNGAVSEKKSCDPKPPELYGDESKHVGLRPRKSEVQTSSRNKSSDKITPFAKGKSADYVNVQRKLPGSAKDEAAVTIDSNVNTYESLNACASGFDETRIYADLKI